MLAKARQLADRVTVDRQGRPVTIEWRTECWANVNRRGQANKLHTHPGCFWSGTYYVDDGGVAEDPSLGGEFEFFDPRGVGPLLGETERAVLAPGVTQSSPLVRPRTGMMVLFPSWMPMACAPIAARRRVSRSPSTWRLAPRRLEGGGMSSAAAPQIDFDRLALFGTP